MIKSGFGVVSLARAAVAILGCATGVASAANLVVNGSFETGNTTGWTISSGACAWQSLTVGATTSQAGTFVAPAPTDGVRVLLSDASSIQTCTFQQDVAIPSGQLATLTLDAGYNYRNFVDPTGAGCAASLAVTTTGGAPLATVYSATGGTNQPLASRPAVNLSAFAGSTVRIIASTTSCTGGPAGIILDNVVLTAAATPVPTLGQWGLSLLALLLAGAAMLVIRKRATAV